jgi:hydrogenase-4 component E
MINSIASQLLIIVMLLNFGILGSSRIRFHIKLIALQGLILGIIPLLLPERIEFHNVAVSAVLITSKAIIIPMFLMKTVEKVKIKLEVENYISFTYSVLLGAAGTTLIFVFSKMLPLAGGHTDIYFVQIAISTIFIAFIVMISRIKAISHVIGYLLLENGILIFGFLISAHIPFSLEFGFLLDLIVGIFIMGIVMNHIDREFSSIDITQLKSLRER